MLLLTLNSIRGPFRPESNFAYTQHWYLADVALKTLRILQSRLSEWRKPIKILKRKISRYVISKLKKIHPNQHSRALEARWSLIM